MLIRGTFINLLCRPCLILIILYRPYCHKIVIACTWQEKLRKMLISEYFPSGFHHIVCRNFTNLIFFSWFQHRRELKKLMSLKFKDKVAARMGRDERRPDVTFNAETLEEVFETGDTWSLLRLPVELPMSVGGLIVTITCVSGLFKLWPQITT